MSVVIKPEVRKTSELLFHSDSAPGKRFVFVEENLYPKSELYIIGRRVEAVPKKQPEYVESHRHKTNSFYLFVGDKDDLGGLEARINIDGKEFVAESPSAVMIPKYSLHNYKLTNGSGWFFHINLCADYNKSLASDDEIGSQTTSNVQINELYNKAKKQLKRVESSERPLTTNSRNIQNPKRWVFVSPKHFHNPGIYSAIHQISSNKPFEYEMNLHYHTSDEVYLIFGKKEQRLEISVFDGEKKTRIESPAAIYHPKGSPHKYEYLKGEGLLLVVLKEGVPGEGYKFVPI